MTALTVSEQSQLSELEETIESNLDGFYKVGQALTTIRNGKLYRQTHDTFEAYCRERWDFTRQRAYQLIWAAETVDQLKSLPEDAGECKAALYKTTPEPKSSREALKAREALKEAERQDAAEDEPDREPGDDDEAYPPISKVKDALGNCVPLALEDVFKRRDAFGKAERTLRALGRETTKELKPGPAGERFDSLEFDRLISSAADKLKDGAPFTTCPYCKDAVPLKGCKFCKSRGWITKPQYEEVQR